MIRNSISREVNVVLEIYKIQVRPYIDYCTHTEATVSRQKLGRNFEIEEHIMKSDKTNKNSLGFMAFQPL